MGRPWIAFFSQTGSEIVDLANKLDKWPDAIITNYRPNNVREINKNLHHYIEVSNKPSLVEIKNILQKYDNPLITLHGWLRIMPPEICEGYNIYNGHPGLITLYPELKGKDPQIRAWEAKHPLAGTVIHKVVEGVDEGKVISIDGFDTDKLDKNEFFRILKHKSKWLWIDFLKDKI